MSNDPFNDIPYSEELIEGRPVLLCDVCLRAFNGDDDVTDTCSECGREGLCRHCAEVGEHDCNEPRHNLLGGSGDEAE